VNDVTLRHERLSDERSRIFNGNQIIAHLNWTDSMWVLTDAADRNVIHAFTDLRDPEDQGMAFLKSFPHLSTDTVLDFLLDPPTYVGQTEGERKCWVYTVWKMAVQTGKAPVKMVEWEDKNYAAAQAIYRRVVRKYGDNPPDKADELRELQA
jgi:hypothetical protein